MKKYFLMFLVLTVIFFTCTSAYAMTGLEFMKSTSKEQHKVLDPIIYEYISKGYKHVPDWAYLSVIIGNTVRERGWGNKDLKDIIPEAAKKAGMTK